MTRATLRLITSCGIAAAATGCSSTKPTTAASPGSHVMPEFVVPSQGANPFSAVVRVGNLLFVAGQLGTDANGLVKGGIGPETTAALQNICNVLKRAGSSMDRVAKCTVTCASGDFMNIVSGKMNPQMAFMSGKLKIKGDMGLAMKLQKVIG